MTKLTDYLTSNLGHCYACMRKSFQLAALAWAVTFALAVAGAEVISTIGLVVAFALSLLWLTHLAIFAARNASASAGDGALALPLHSFFQHFGYAAGETAVLYRRGVRDRFGLPLLGRSYLLDLRNEDGSRTAYLKTTDDVAALVKELTVRGYIGDVLKPEYWMSTDSCERSATKDCKNNTCDKVTQSCKATGGMQACRCS